MKFYHLILYLIILFSFSCENTASKQINFNLYLSENIANESDKVLPKVILELLEPIECQEGSNAIVNLIIHRYDSEPTQSEVIEIPLGKADKAREKLNLLSFIHIAQAFRDNSSTFPNRPILYKEPSVKATNLKKKEYDILTQSTTNFICCVPTESPNGQNVADLKSLITQLKNSVCVTDNHDFSIIYKTSPVVEPSSPVQEVFTFLGNPEIDPQLRLSSIEKYSSVFAENAKVRVMGPNGTLFEPEAIGDYLQKIALYRSLDKIEVKEARINENDKYWEVHLKEFHQNITE